MKFRLFSTSVFIICISLTLKAQNSNIEILGKLGYENTLSDVWGYTNNNMEYALVGVQNGVSIVDVSEPTNLKEVQFVEGFFANARDIKTYKDFAYSTNGKEEGLLIIDLKELPNKVTVNKFFGPEENTFTASHNLFIDEYGFLYVVGHNISPGGILIFDLKTNNWQPELVGIYDDNYVHDVYVKENILYTSEGDRMAIIEASNKSNLTILGTQKTYGYTHNSWLSENGNTLFTTDETSGTWVVAWDISTPADIKELGKIQSTPGGTVIPHNTIWLNNYLVTSYYTDGLIIFDAAEPKALVKVAQFDTAPQFSGDGFNGCWGTYPFLPSGNILATDIEEGLYVLSANYKKAAFLSGLVTDSLLNNALDNVNISLKNETTNTSTDLTGSYIIGVAKSGTYEIEFAKPGYFSANYSVDLLSGATMNFDAKLRKDDSYVPVDIPNLTQQMGIVYLSENPFFNEVELSLEVPHFLNNNFDIHFYSINGHLIEKKKITNKKVIWGATVANGIYQYVISTKGTPVYAGKIVKIK